MDSFKYLENEVLPLLSQAVKSGDIGSVKSILDENGRFVVDNIWSWNRLFKVAQQNNKEEMLKFLMQKSCDPELLKKARFSFNADTPLHWAIGGGYLDVIELFIDKDFDCKPLNGSGYLPLTRACSFDGFKALELCLKHKEKFGNDQDYVDLLVECAKRDDTRHIKLLLDNKVSVTAPSKDSIYDKDSINALEATVFSNKWYILDTVLEAKPSRSDLIDMFDFAVKNLRNYGSGPLVKVLHRFEIFDFAKQQPELIKKWLEQIAQHIDNVCSELRFSGAVKSLGVAIVLSSEFLSHSVLREDEAYSKLEDLVYNGKWSLIKQFREFLQKPLESYRSLESLKKFHSYISQSKVLDTSDQAIKLNGLIEDVMNEADKKTNDILFNYLQNKSNDQRYKSLEIWEKVQKIQEDNELSREEQKKQIKELDIAAQKDKGVSKILPDNVISNILEMLGTERALEISDIFSDPFHIFYEKEFYKLGQSFTEVEDEPT